MNIEQIKEIQKMLELSSKSDWSENDPNLEFKIIADKLLSIIPTQRDEVINTLSQFICDDDVSKALDNLEKQAEINGSIPALDIVTILEPFDNKGWTVDDLLDKL